VRDHLFEQSVTTKQGGSGIGLMLVRRALEKHGASVQVHSELGKGTQFVCVFPVAPRLMQVSEQATVAV
jgi:signal transduction histidine kinase